ncbi:MAG: signal recognition particle-docking protein FtsY [Alphaproteobacteria bacterium]|nr:signal recognition particle-docking protein FtsY [Alphaproteobacteria bacterium]
MSFFGFGKKKTGELPTPEEALQEPAPAVVPEATPATVPLVATPDFAELLSEAVAADAAVEASEQMAEPARETATVAPLAEEKLGWFGRLKAGLQKSTSKFSEGITGIFTKRKLDADTLQELEDLLITADLGPQLAARLTAEFGKNRFGKDISDTEVKQALAQQMTEILAPYAAPLVLDGAKQPQVVLIIGVNGVGKTTTIGKFARHYRTQGNKVMLAAGDTFRAAAISQLQIWGERTGCPVVTLPQGGDAAALAYTALERAKAEGMDLLLIDTAGRLHNKADLMEELAKIIRVIKKLDATAPHNTLLVLDATTGQNALAQAETFLKMAAITGLIVTKLDGSAKGGMLVALAEKMKLPVHAIGVGEGADDLRPFTAEDYAKALVGLE